MNKIYILLSSDDGSGVTMFDNKAAADEYRERADPEGRIEERNCYPTAAAAVVAFEESQRLMNEGLARYHRNWFAYLEWVKINNPPLDGSRPMSRWVEEYGEKE